MNAERSYPGMDDRHDAVVTYSRVPSWRRRRRLPREERAEPVLDAVEIRGLDRYAAGDAAFAAMPRDLRAEPRGDEADLVDEERRPSSTRAIFISAALLMIAGTGILAASIGLVTVAPGNVPVEAEASGAPALQLAASDPAPEPAASLAPVREISLSAGAEAPATEAVPAVEAAGNAPPLPRPRPDAAGFEPQAGVASKSVAAAPAVTPAAAPKPAATAAAPRPGDTDALITSIEETLSRVDAGPATLRGPDGALAPPAVLLPPSAYPPSGGGYPMHDDVHGPYDDVMPPPPVTENGYPIPPEPVPYLYPPQPMGYEPEADTRRPGLVRRTIAKTTGAVARVFSRDR